MKHLRTLLLAVMAGIAIGIGGTVFLAMENSIVGAVLFSVGLYAICAHGLNLFTGKVGYLPNQKPAYLLDLAIIWVGNLIGTLITGVLVSFTRFNDTKSAAMCTVKLNDSLLSLFILAIFCGLLMYIAVEGYKQVKNPLILIFPVAVFILCGFEHCIADMFYFSIAGMWSPSAVGRILIITLGNSVGGCLIPLCKKVFPPKEENK